LRLDHDATGESGRRNSGTTVSSVLSRISGRPRSSAGQNGEIGSSALRRHRGPFTAWAFFGTPQALRGFAGGLSPTAGPLARLLRTCGTARPAEARKRKQGEARRGSEAEARVPVTGPDPRISEVGRYRSFSPRPNRKVRCPRGARTSQPPLSRREIGQPRCFRHRPSSFFLRSDFRLGEIDHDPLGCRLQMTSVTSAAA
jgi:hypothetical protein